MWPMLSTTVQQQASFGVRIRPIAIVIGSNLLCSRFLIIQGFLMLFCQIPGTKKDFLTQSHLLTMAFLLRSHALI